MPERVPHILEKGSDKVAYDILKQLADGPRRPAELRAALGIAGANFFTARVFSPASWEEIKSSWEKADFGGMLKAPCKSFARGFFGG